MKILTVGPDMSDYVMGTYHHEWAKVLTDMKCVNKYKQPFQLLRSRPDLIILEHSFQIEVKNNKFNRLARRVPLKIRTLFCIIFGFLNLRFFLLKIVTKKAKTIMLSRNDYKEFDEKKEIADFFNVDVTVTHTKKALMEFKRREMKALWIPFSVSCSFSQDWALPNQRGRKFLVGLRGSVVRADLYPERRQRIEFSKALSFLETSKSVSISIWGDNEPEDYLPKNEYIEWLQTIEIFAFNPSANGTVGPKYFEAIACGCVVIAPEEEYEGLLKPYVHYLPCKTDFSDLQLVLDSYLSDPTIKRELLENSRKLLKHHFIEKQVERILASS